MQSCTATACPCYPLQLTILIAPPMLLCWPAVPPGTGAVCAGSALQDAGGPSKVQQPGQVGQRCAGVKQGPAHGLVASPMNGKVELPLRAAMLA